MATKTIKKVLKLKKESQNGRMKNETSIENHIAEVEIPFGSHSDRLGKIKQNK